MKKLVEILALAAVCACLSPAADINLASGVTVAPGEWAALAVTLAAPAPEGGVIVSVTSSDPNVLAIDHPMIQIYPGQTVPLRQPQVNGINFGTAAVTVSAFGLSGSTQNVRVAAALLGPDTVQIDRGTAQNVVLSLSYPAPAAVPLIVTCDNPSVAGVPASAIIPASASAIAIPVSGLAAGSTAIHISGLPAVAQKDVMVNVVAPASITVPSALSLPLGLSMPFSVTLGAPAGPSGVLVNLSSSDATKVTISPSSIMIPAGQTMPLSQPVVTAVDLGGATVTASAAGFVSGSTTIGSTATLSFSPSALTVSGTGLQKIVLALSAAAPWVTGITAQLTSSNPSVAIVPQSINFFPDGSSTSGSVVAFQPVNPGTTTITASVPPYIAAATATITVLPSGGSTPNSIGANGGTPQSAVINTVFGSALSAIVKDVNGAPVSGATVQFQLPASGASGTFAGGISSAVTNALGIATSAAITANAITGSWTATASVPGVASVASFVLSNTSLASGVITLPSNTAISPGQSVPFPVTISIPAPAGGLTISLSSSDPAKATITPATITVGPGATVPAVQASVNGLDFGDVTISATAPGYTSAGQLAKVGASLSFQPSVLSVSAGAGQSLNLTLSANAPAAGLVVQLSSSNPAASVQPSVTIPGGSNAVAVPVSGISAGSATITAHTASPNVIDANASVTVNAGSDISLASGITVAPGDWVDLPLTLAAPAPQEGVIVTLASSDQGIVSVFPSLIRINAGSTAPARLPQVHGTGFGTATVSASAYGLSGDSRTVLVAATLAGVSNATIPRGVTENLAFAIGTVSPVPLVLALSSDNPSIASVPASATIPANQLALNVPVTALTVGSTNIHVGAPPTVAQKDIAVTVSAPATISLPTTLSIPLSTSVPLALSLGSPAGASGVTVSLSSSDLSRVIISPASVFISPGQVAPSTPPQVTAMDLGGAIITASAPGYGSATSSVAASATLSFTPASTTVSGTSLQRLFLALSATAPWVTGIQVQLTSSNPGVAIVPSVMSFYPDGSSSNTIVVVFQPTGVGTTTITASSPFLTPASATVTVLP
jgi:hypothetical protein